MLTVKIGEDKKPKLISLLNNLPEETTFYIDEREARDRLIKKLQGNGYLQVTPTEFGLLQMVAAKIDMFL